MSHLEGSQAGGNSPLLRRRSTFCSIQAFNRLDEAHPHEGGQSALHGLSI